MGGRNIIDWRFPVAGSRGLEEVGVVRKLALALLLADLGVAVALAGAGGDAAELSVAVVEVVPVEVALGEVREHGPSTSRWIVIGKGGGRVEAMVWNSLGRLPLNLCLYACNKPEGCRGRRVQPADGRVRDSENAMRAHESVTKCGFVLGRAGRWSKGSRRVGESGERAVVGVEF
jgi:hypothetical protein